MTGKIGELLGNSQTAADDAESLNEDVAAALEEVRRLRNEAANGTSLLKEVLKKAADSKANANSFGKSVSLASSKI